MKETIQTKSVIKFIALRKHMKHTSPKMIFKSTSIQHTLRYFLTKKYYNWPADFCESFKAYSTLFQIPSRNYFILSSLKPPNVPLFFNSTMIFPNYSSYIPPWDVLISSNMVKIVTWGGITVKVGILSVLFQVNVSVQIFIK